MQVSSIEGMSSKINPWGGPIVITRPHQQIYSTRLENLRENKTIARKIHAEYIMPKMPASTNNQD